MIGRNEESNIDRCFTSIYSAIQFNEIESYELIYVDSRSTDRSISIAKGFSEVKTYKLCHHTNAAIARNAGGLEATGEYLFFIDADMAVNKDFLAEASYVKDLKNYAAISGVVIDVVEGKETSVRFKRDTGSFVCPQILDGGTFLIQKSAWQKLGGMNTKFKTGEDGDLGLRMAQFPLKFCRKPEPIVHHHMIHYHDPSRMWKMVRDKSIFYSRAVLYRHHLLNKYMYCMLWKNDKSLIALIISLTASLVFPSYLLLFFSIYLVIIFLKCIRSSSRARLIEFFLYMIIIDILNIVYFFTFYPEDKPVEYAKC